jgi:hypothetical protein
MLPPNAPRHRFTAAFPFLARMVKPAKIALMAWGAFSLGAVVGMSVFYPAYLATATAPASTATSALPAECLAALIDATLPTTTMAASFSREAAFAPQVRRGEFLPTPALATSALAPDPAMTVEARLPRPRPEDSIITGSITPAASVR